MAKSRNKGKEKLSFLNPNLNDDYVIDIPDETAPLLQEDETEVSQAVASPRTYAKPLLLKPAALLEDIKKTFRLLKFAQEGQTKKFQDQKKARNAVVRKNVLSSCGLFSPYTLSLASNAVGWTAFGIRQKQADDQFDDLGTQFKEAIANAKYAWTHSDIPGEDETCFDKYFYLDMMDCFEAPYEAICQALLNQYCDAQKSLQDWADSAPNLDVVQIILLTFSVIAALSLCILVVGIPCCVTSLSNLPPIPKLIYFGDESWKKPLSLLNNEQQVEVERVLSKLESVSGIKVPAKFDEVIKYLKDMGPLVQKNQRAANFLFHLLENQRSDKSSNLYKFYQTAKESMIPQIILNYSAEVGFAKPENKLKKK